MCFSNKSHSQHFCAKHRLCCSQSRSACDHKGGLWLHPHLVHRQSHKATKSLTMTPNPFKDALHDLKISQDISRFGPAGIAAVWNSLPLGLPESKYKGPSAAGMERGTALTGASCPNGNGSKHIRTISKHDRCWDADFTLD